jgi:hypothetical protein
MLGLYDRIAIDQRGRTMYFSHEHQDSVKKLPDPRCRERERIAIDQRGRTMYFSYEHQDLVKELPDPRCRERGD